MAVIGGGPGGKTLTIAIFIGYVAAIKGAQKGLKTVCIEKRGTLGGTCINVGCIPSKALLHVAKLINEAAESEDCGVTFSAPVINLDKLRSFKNSVVNNLSGGIESLCKARGVELIKARGTLISSDALEVKTPDGTTRTISFDHCIVATGSQPAMPPMFALGDDRIMDSTGALEL